MGLDIRTPIGLMFSIFGALLVGYGLLTRGSEIYARSGGTTSTSTGAWCSSPSEA